MIHEAVQPHFPSGHRPHALGQVWRSGFTLIEALSASIILFLTVSALAMALTAGRQQSLAAQDRVQAALAAEALLSEILADGYANLITYHLRDEAPGTMVTASSGAYPDEYYRLGRRVTVVSRTHSFVGLGANITGKEVTVEVYNEADATVLSLVQFVPEPSGS